MNRAGRKGRRRSRARARFFRYSAAIASGDPTWATASRKASSSASAFALQRVIGVPELELEVGDERRPRRLRASADVLSIPVIAFSRSNMVYSFSVASVRDGGRAR